MTIVLIDKIYNKKNYKSVDEDLSKSFEHESVNFDSEGVIKGSLRVVFEYSPDNDFGE